MKARDTLKQLSSDGLSEKLYSINVVILRVPAPSASVERANLSLKFVKNVYRSKMSEGRLNFLILIYVHKQTKLD